MLRPRFFHGLQGPEFRYYWDDADPRGEHVQYIEHIFKAWEDAAVEIHPVSV